MEFTWISEGKSSLREKNLQRSRALTHAAKASHRARREATQTKQASGTDAGLQVACNSLANIELQEVILRHVHPRLYGPSLDSFLSNGLSSSKQSRRIFDFLKSTYIAEMFLTDGHHASPWLLRNATDVIGSLTLANIHNNFTQAVEEFPYAAALSRVSKTSKDQSHALNCKAVVVLGARQASEKSGTSSDIDYLIAIILKLFTSAVNEADPRTARLHGRTLQTLLFQKAEKDGTSDINETMIAYILYYDYQLAQSTASRTIFDMEFWTTSCAKPATMHIQTFLEPLYSSDIQQLKLLPTSSFLHRVCIALHKWTWLWCRKEQDGLLQSISDPVSILTYFLIELAKIQIRLSNYVMDLQDEIRRQSSLDDGQLYVRYTEIVLALGLLTYLATFAANPVVAQVYLWPKARVYLSQLRAFLPELVAAVAARRRREQESLSDGALHTFWSDYIMLFAFWAGATWEQKGTSDSQNVSTSWFTSRFICLARELGVTDWQGVRRILDQICCCDFARPSGASWVDAELSAHGNGTVAA